MRLIYLFMHKGSAPNTDWNSGHVVKGYSKFAKDFMDEGPSYLFHRMLEEKIIDDIIIFMEVGGETGHLIINDRMRVYMIPDINYIEGFLKPDDIIFCRGGFRGWWLVLDKLAQKGFWTLLYAANTGRQRWTFWDIIFDDLGGKPHHLDKRGRFIYNWKKPTNPKVFFPIETERIYDLCIGASYIHDKKGQWRTIDALVAYQKAYGRNIKCVMPGAPRRGTESNQIIDKIAQHKLDVNVIGMLPREELNKVLNQSKIFIHAGMSGQNDRGPLEALRCGCTLIIASPKYHSPYLIQHPYGCTPMSVLPSYLATTIHASKVSYNEGGRHLAVGFHEQTHGIENVILPEMDRLFSILRNLRKNPKSNAKVLEEKYVLK